MSSNGGVSSESVRNPSEILPRARVNLRESRIAGLRTRTIPASIAVQPWTPTGRAKMPSLSEAQELLSEEQKAARDADLDARLEKLKMEVNQSEPLHVPNPETVKATEELIERLAALRQEHAAAAATADAFRKSIAKLPEKCSIEELKA